jgi:hypothetical protein
MNKSHCPRSCLWLLLQRKSYEKKEPLRRGMSTDLARLSITSRTLCVDHQTLPPWHPYSDRYNTPLLPYVSPICHRTPLSNATTSIVCRPSSNARSLGIFPSSTTAKHSRSSYVISMYELHVRHIPPTLRPRPGRGRPTNHVKNFHNEFGQD